MVCSPASSPCNIKLHSITSYVTDNPIALRVGDYVVFYYGLLMGSAFCAAVATALLHISQAHVDDATLQGYLNVMCCFMFPFAVLGARLFSWVLEDGCKRALIFRPGFYWHGGLLGTMVGCFIGCCVHYDNLDLLPLLDGFGVATPAFEIFNRLGCLSYGCCWGIVVPATHPHAICYRNPHSCIFRKQEPTRHQWRYPVQVYAVALSVVQLLFLAPLSTTTQHWQPGFLFLISMTLSSVVRLFCEKYRGDPRGEGTSSTRFFALVQGVLAVAYGLSSSLWSSPVESSMPVQSPNSTTGALNLLVRNAGSFGAIFLAAVCAYGTMCLPQQKVKNI